MFVAVPPQTFEEFIRKSGRLKGFEVLPEAKLPKVGRYQGKPFPEAVILQHTARMPRFS